MPGRTGGTEASGLMPASADDAIEGAGVIAHAASSNSMGAKDFIGVITLLRFTLLCTESLEAFEVELLKNVHVLVRVVS